jgi:hypothetical protein
MAEQIPSALLHTLRVLCLAQMASVAVVVAAVAAALGKDGTGNTPVWEVAVVIAVAIGAVVLISVFDKPFDPIAPGAAEEESRSRSVSALRITTLIRFAFSEGVVLVAVALAFVGGDGGSYLAVLGLGIAEALMLWKVWPGERVIGEIQAVLESAGGQSFLREALAAPPPALRR